MFESDLDLILSNLDGQLHKKVIVSKNIPKVPKTKTQQNYGLLNNVICMQKMMKEINQSFPTWEESWKRLDESLLRLGFNDYFQYISSSLWKTTCDSYKDSKLLQKCMLCGNTKFVLNHTNYQFVGSEDIEKLLPLCTHHKSKLQSFLSEHHIPLEASFLVLRKLDFKNEIDFNRRLEPYRKCLLNHASSKLNLYMSWENSRIGGKQSNKTDKKMIFIGHDRFYFDSKIGKIQLGYNGHYVGFERFCDDLPKYLSEYCSNERDAVRLKHEFI